MIGGFIAVLFFQNALSKILHSGMGWFLSGDTLFVETIIDGTTFGQQLTRIPILFPMLSILTGIFEFSFIIIFLFPSLHLWLGIIAFVFHFGTFLVMGISFWFLWPLYIPLFILNKTPKKTLH
jgi:hypothetical protein